ncbi:MAG: LCCL domain-containing protein [Polyangiales bacterium]
MAEDPPRSFLEPAGPAAPTTPSAPRAGGFLEPAPAAVPPPPAAPPPPTAPPLDVALVGQTLDALAAAPDGASLLELLFPNDDRADLVRNPRSQRQLEERLAEVELHLTAADRDGGAHFKRDRVRRARAALDRALGRMGARDGLAHAAANELRARQTERFRAEIERHGAVDPATGARTRRLYGSDLLKVDDEARRHGLTAEEGRAFAAAAGFELLATEARAWTPCPALPGAPTTLDAASEALLAHPAAGAEALRRGELSRWLASHQADAAIVDRVKAIEQRLRAGADAPSLSVHGVAWALGRLELRLGQARLRQPAALANLLMRDPAAAGDLELLARDGVLAPWLQWHGQAVPARFAEQYALALRTPGGAADAEALGWSLGVPLMLAGSAVRDARELADHVLGSEVAQREAMRMAAEGRLAVWLESLPPARTDVVWRRGLGDPELARLGPGVAFWFGVYRNASDRALQVQRAGGGVEEVGDLEPLREVVRAAPLWDGLKACARNGRLLGWLFQQDPDAARRWLASAPARSTDSDVRLNGLLWALGAQGMVVEWGERDRAVRAPADLVALYREDPLRLEEQARKGYPLDWLDAYGGQVEASDPAAWRRALAYLRAMAGRAPDGHLALGVALLGGLSSLPLDPLRPGGERGVVSGVRPLAPGEPADLAWAPLAEHLRSGVALVWLWTAPHAAFASARSHAAALERTSTPEARAAALVPLVGAPVVGDPRTSSSPSFAPPLAPSPFASYQGYPPQPPSLTPVPLPASDRRGGGPSVAPWVALAMTVAAASAGVYHFRSRAPEARDAGVDRPTVLPRPRARMCAVTSGAPTVIGRAGDANTGLRVSWSGEEAAVGWRVPRQHRYGPDDSAVARLDFRGALIEMPDGEDPPRDHNADWSPRTVQRVQPVYEGGALRTLLAEVLRTQDSESVRCGDFVSTWWVPRGGLAAEEGAQPLAVPLFGPSPLSSRVRPEEMGAAYYCRPLSPTRPFVLAAHANAGPDGSFLPKVSVVVTRGASLAEARPLVELDAPRSVARAASAESPLSTLRGDASPSGALAVEVPGRGHALAFHYGHSVYFAWLDASLAVVGSVQEFEVANTSHDPSLAVKGDALLFVLADHPSRRDDRSPFAVFARRASFGQPLGPATRLDTADAAGGSEVSPAVAPLPAGWLVTWSLRVPASGEPATRTLWARTYGDDLRAEGPAIRLLEGGGEGAVVTRGDRFVVAAMTGRGEHAPVQAIAGDCVLRDVPDAPPTPAPAAAAPTVQDAAGAVASDWGATAEPWARQVGQRLRFSCPADGSGNAVGSEPYATMSSVCEAAVHAGLIQRGVGGAVTVVIGERLRRFEHSSRNGVSSRYSNRRRGSFTFAR